MPFTTLVREAWKTAKSESLYSRDYSPQTTWERIGWWESRRVPYNLIVGIVGLFTCILFALVGVTAEVLFGSEFGMPDPPIFGVFLVALYAVGANICYTGGWIAELCVAKLWPREADRFASRTFSLGLALSVLLTLTPGLILFVAGILGLVRHFARAVG